MRGNRAPANEEQGLGYYQQSCRVEKMKIRNRETGELVEIDKDHLRIRRCQRRVHAWADLLKDYINDKSGHRLVMVTLTYRPGDEWHSNDIRAFMLTVRTQLKTNLLAYAWVAELQARGAVHYHVLLLVKRGTNIPKPDEAGWWNKGTSRIETSRSTFYIVTYTGKAYQKKGEFPVGLRMFAVWIAEGAISSVDRFLFRLSAVPEWFRQVLLMTGEHKAKYTRSPGGGWLFHEKVYRSQWVLVSIY